MKRLAVVVFLIAAMSACGGEPEQISTQTLAVAQTAAAPPYEYSPDGVLTTYWAIRSNYDDSYCIEGGYSNGDDVQLAGCPSGEYWLLRMVWEVVLAERGYYKIINRYSGLCLEYRGTGSTNYYKEITCDNDDEQRFSLPSWPGSQNTAIRPKSASTYYVWPQISADRVYNLTSSTTWHLYTQS